MVPDHIGRRLKRVPVQLQEVIGVRQHIDGVLRPIKVLVFESECPLVNTQPARKKVRRGHQLLDGPSEQALFSGKHLLQVLLSGARIAETRRAKQPPCDVYINPTGLLRQLTH